MGENVWWVGGGLSRAKGVKGLWRSTGGSVTESPRPDTRGREFPGLRSSTRAVSMDYNKFSSLGVATSDVARPLALTHAANRKPSCLCCSPGLVIYGQRAGRGSAEHWDGASAVASLCHAAMGCLSQVEAECTVRAVGELSPPWGPSSKHDSAAWPLLSPPDTNRPSCGWFLDPGQHFVYLAGIGSL